MTAQILGSYREFRHDAYMEAARGALRKAHKAYVAFVRPGPNAAKDFLRSALAHYRRGDIDLAMETFEAGLDEHPSAERLLASYFRVCCEQDRLVRLVDFISPTKKQLCQTLARLPISESAPAYRLAHHVWNNDAIWLTEEIISRNFDDALKLWRLADLLEHADKVGIANKIHQRLARRTPKDAEDYLYGGVSEMRLGNVEAGFERLELGLKTHPRREYMRSVYKDCCYMQVSFERYQKLNDIFPEEAAVEPWSALSFYRNVLKRHPLETFALKLKEAEIHCGPADYQLLLDELFAHVCGNIASLDKERLHSFLVRLADIDANLSTNMFLEAIKRFQTEDDPWLTDELIKNRSDDALKLWQLAGLLGHAGKVEIATKIHRILSMRTLSTATDYVYGGISHMRLGCVDVGFETLERGLAAHPGSEAIISVTKDCCYAHVDFERYQRLFGLSGVGEAGKPSLALDFYRATFKVVPAEHSLMRFKDVTLNCTPDDVLVLKEELLARLRCNTIPFNRARLSIVLSRIIDLDPDFAEQVFQIFHSMDWGSDDEAKKYVLALINKLTLPMVHGRGAEMNEFTPQFIADARALAQSPMELSEPLSDAGGEFMVWQSLFCLGQPLLYSDAISALETLAFKLWPGLDYTAPHIGHPVASCGPGRKIRIGFTVLDSMPMMSGLMERLDKDVFETVYLRPGKAKDSKTATDWIARAGSTVEYSNTDAYAAMNTIAGQELDILISGPSGPQIFFPVMARLAHLQMVLLEPNWPDGIKNNDYYISWQAAEPENHGDYYKTPVALLRRPPYWIERSALGDIASGSGEPARDIRQRLLGLGPKDRLYICANTHPKIHPVMDEMLSRVLEADPAGSLVFLRGDAATAHPLKLRMKEKLGRLYERVSFVNTLQKNDAHALLLSADCCLDSYPICGMSSSFDGMMLGVPIVTLPSDRPFGRWTAAIYEYIGVSGLTAGNADEYVSIATKLATDKEWRHKKSAEIREKSSRYVESQASFDEFQDFIIQAWRRKQGGLPPGNWVAGEWR